MKRIIAMLTALLVVSGCSGTSVNPADNITPGPTLQTETPALSPTPISTPDAEPPADLSAVTTPVLIRGLLMGGLVRGEWLSADAFYGSGTVHFDGYRYDMYRDDIYMGEATGGPLMSFQTAEPLDPDGDVYDSYVNLYKDNGQDVAFDIALQGDWELYPRAYTAQGTDSEEYLALVKSLLTCEGLIDPVTSLHQVVSVDLDGDGIDEVLIAADNTINGEYPETKKGDNAILAFHRMSGEQAIDQTVDAYIVPEDTESSTNYRILFYVRSCADLDGDGCLEVIIQRYNAWGAEYSVYKLVGDQLVRVASNGTV